MKIIDRSNGIKWSDGGLKMKNISMKSKLIVSALGALMVSGQAGAMFAPQSFESFMKRPYLGTGKWSRLAAGKVGNYEPFQTVCNWPYCSRLKRFANPDYLQKLGQRMTEVCAGYIALRRAPWLLMRLAGGGVGYHGLYQILGNNVGEALDRNYHANEEIRKAVRAIDRIAKENNKKLDEIDAKIGTKGKSNEILKKDREKHQVFSSNIKKGFKNVRDCWKGCWSTPLNQDEKVIEV